MNREAKEIYNQFNQTKPALERDLIVSNAESAKLRLIELQGLLLRLFDLLDFSKDTDSKLWNDAHGNYQSLQERVSKLVARPQSLASPDATVAPQVSTSIDATANVPLTPERKKAILGRLEKLHATFHSVYKQTTHTSQLDSVKEIQSLAEQLGDDEAKRWGLTLLLYDGMLEGASLSGNNEFPHHLCYDNELDSWSLVAGKINFENMRELMAIDVDVKNSWKALNIIMSGGNEYFGKLIAHLNNEGLDIPVGDSLVTLEQACTWDYVRYGEPREADDAIAKDNQHPKRAIPLTELLGLIFPQSRTSSRRSAVDIAICTGLRSKAFLPYCYVYSESPKEHSGVKGPAKFAAPLAYNQYYERKRAWLPIDTRDWMFYYDYNADIDEYMREHVEKMRRHIPDAQDPNKVEDVKIQRKYDSNVAKLVRLKRKIEQFFTTSPFSKYQEQVNLHEWDDKIQILPLPVDLLNESSLSAQKLDLDEYCGGIKAWNELVAFIRGLSRLSFPKDKGEDGLAYVLGQLSDKNSPIKSIIGGIKDTAYLKRFEKAHNFLHLVALKRMFVAYNNAERGKGFKSLAGYQNDFARIVSNSFLATSLPDNIQEFVSGLMQLRPETRGLLSPEPEILPTLSSGLRAVFNKEAAAQLAAFFSQEMDEEAKKD